MSYRSHKRSKGAGGGGYATATESRTFGTRSRAPKQGVSHHAPRRYVSGVAGETKYFDVGINTSVTSSAASWADSEVPADNYINSSGAAAAFTESQLVPNAIGSGYGQVNGNRYLMKKIRVRGQIFFTANLEDLTDLVGAVIYRLMLVMDTAPNGTQAQGEDVMQDLGANENLYSFKRMAEQGSRFRILKDQIGHLQPAVAGTDGSNTNSQRFESAAFSFQYAPTKPILCNIRSGNAVPAIAGLVDCNIFLLLATNGSGMTIMAASRCYYMDK